MARGHLKKGTTMNPTTRLLGTLLIAASFPILLAACAKPADSPAVIFSASVHIGEAPLDVLFTDASTLPAQKCNNKPDPAIDAWSWDFGDGQTAQGAQPAHTYQDPGVYSVTLNIAATDGTTAAKTRRSFVTVLDPNRVQGTTPGQERSVAGIEFVWIPAGTFTMGSAPYTYAGDVYVEQDATPVHQVTFDYGFWMSKYEMRQDYWEAVMGDNPALFDEFPAEIGYPVESVSWSNVQDFLDEINALGQGLFRLPSEAEWEYACRAGTGSSLPFPFPATVEQVSAHAACPWTSPYSTQPVGQFLPNPWGLYDMHGNVAEWTQDVYNSDYYTADSAVNPFGPENGPYRSARGGSFRDPIYLMISSTRLGYLSQSIYYFIGFRIVLQ